MKKKIFLSVSLLILSGASYGFYLYHKPHKQIAQAMPELFITSNKLITQFEENKGTISNTLLNKIIEVSGIITTIEQSKEGTIIILNGGVKCELDKLQAKELTKRQFLMVKGVYSGFDEMFNEISLIRCHLVN